MYCIVTAFMIGLVVGIVLGGLAVIENRRKWRMSMTTSHAIQDRLNMAHSFRSRLVLKDLEAGDYERAKETLSASIAISYYTVLTPEACIPEVEKERREIERQATASSVLAAALVSKKLRNPLGPFQALMEENKKEKL